MRSNVRLTAVESKRVPSWNVTSSRSVNVYFFELSSIVHFVASHGCSLRSLSIDTSESVRLPTVSNAAPPLISAGSSWVLSCVCPQVSVPPRFGAALGVAAAGALVAGALVLGVHAATAAAALAACAPANTVAPSAPAGSAPAAPKRGGTLTWGQVGDNTLIDFSLVQTSSAYEVAGNLSDGLVAIDPDGNLHPWLATKWSMESDAKRFSFTLRDDVKFHDGTVFDSTAVKRTFERTADPKTKATQGAVYLGPLDHVETPDPRTATLVYRDPHPLLLLNLWQRTLAILSPKQLDTLKPGEILTAPVGTGRYKFVSRTSDGVVTME